MRGGWGQEEKEEQCKVMTIAVNTAVPGQVLLETEQRWRTWVSAGGMIVDITTQRCTAVQPIITASPAVSAARLTETVNIYAQRLPRE